VIHRIKELETTCFSMHSLIRGIARDRKKFELE